MTRPISHFRVLDTFSFVPKQQVRIYFFSRSRHSHDPVLSSCRDGNSYKLDMSSQGPGVHRATQLSRSSPWSLEYVPPFLV
jgi:hypothetical protein